jgi:putative oxidoreductase
MQWFASTATEIGVGVLLIVGFLTPLAAAGTIGVMTVAFFSVHRSVGFWVTARPDEGWEYVMLIAVTSAAIAIGGPGEISVDGALGIATDFNGWIGAGVALAGVVVALLQLAIFFRPSEVATD